MSFKKLPDNRGLIYVPEWTACKKKNPCPDCFSCQWCGSERCRVCKGKPPAISPDPGRPGADKK